APNQPETKLMTVRVEECDLSGLLATITYVDLVGVADQEQARTRLLNQVSHMLAGRARPAGHPAYPGSGPVEPDQPVPRPPSRRMPATAPPFPLAAPARVGAVSLTVLHVAGPGFGRGQSRGQIGMDGPRDASSLQARIFGDVTELVHAGAPM